MPQPTRFLVHVQGGWLDSRVVDLAKRLVERDHRLEITARCDSNRQVLSYDLYWRSDDGRQHLVGSWQPHEIDQVETDLALMDRNGARYTPTIDRVDKANAARERDNSRAHDDRWLAMMEHAIALHQDTTGPRRFFGQAGYGPGKR